MTIYNDCLVAVFEAAKIKQDLKKNGTPFDLWKALMIAQHWSEHCNEHYLQVSFVNLGINRNVTFYSSSLTSGRERLYYSSTFVLAMRVAFWFEMHVISLCCDLSVVRIIICTMHKITKHKGEEGLVSCKPLF